jgi:hypothetical protein
LFEKGWRERGFYYGVYKSIETKTKSPRICIMLFAGRTHENSSTITPFHRSFPIRERIMSAIMNESMRDTSSM